MSDSKVNQIFPIPRDEVNFHDIYAGKFKREFSLVAAEEKYLFMACSL